MTVVHFKTKLYSREAFNLLKKALELEDAIVAFKKKLGHRWYQPNRPTRDLFGGLSIQNDGEVVVELRTRYFLDKTNLDGRVANFYADSLKKLMNGTFADKEIAEPDRKIIVSDIRHGVDMEKLKLVRTLISSKSSIDDILKRAPAERHQMIRDLIGKPLDPLTTGKNKILLQEIQNVQELMDEAVGKVREWHDAEIKSIEAETTKRVAAARKPFEDRIAELKSMMTLPAEQTSTST